MLTGLEDALQPWCIAVALTQTHRSERTSLDARRRDGGLGASRLGRVARPVRLPAGLLEAGDLTGEAQIADRDAGQTELTVVRGGAR